MSDHDIITYGVLAIISILGFLMKRSIVEQDKKIQDLKDNVHENTVEIATTKQNYLHKDDFKEFKIELRGMFEEIRNDIRSLRG